MDGTSTELDSDRQVMLLSEALVSELEQQARLANTYRLFSVINLSDWNQ